MRVYIIIWATIQLIVKCLQLYKPIKYFVIAQWCHHNSWQTIRMHVCVCVYPTINGFVVSTGMSSCQVLTVLWQNLGQPKCHNAYPVYFQICNGIVLQTCYRQASNSLYTHNCFHTIIILIMQSVTMNILPKFISKYVVVQC